MHAHGACGLWIGLTEMKDFTLGGIEAEEQVVGPFVFETKVTLKVVVSTFVGLMTACALVCRQGVGWGTWGHQGDH